MKVVLITPPLDASGGIGRVMTYVLREIPVSRFDIRVLDSRGYWKNPIWSAFTLGSTWIRLVYIGLMWRPDVVHINISSHGSTIRKSVMVWTCRALRLPILLHLHSGNYPDFFATVPHWAKRLVRLTFQAADTVAVLGDQWRAYAERELCVDPRRIVVLPNAVPGPGRLLPRSSAAAVANILFLGRIGEHKGVSSLLFALASPEIRQQGWHATFAGDGEVTHYREKAAALGIADRLDFIGWIEADRVAELLQNTQVLLLPSRAEGLPLAVLEALAYGVPVICTPVGALPEVIHDGVNGLLVGVGDQDQLESALLSILQDEDRRLQLAKGARETWQRAYDIKLYAVNLERLWADISNDARGIRVPSRGA